MTLEQIIVGISVIGSVASIIGAWLSIRHAKRAKSSADIAEKAKEEIYSKQSHSEFSAILTEAKRVQNAFSKYRLPSQTRTLDGLNHEKDIEEFQNLLFKLNENKSKILKFKEFKFTNFYSRATTSLDNFSERTESNEIQKYGIEILKILDEIVSILRKEIDEFNKK